MLYQQHAFQLCHILLHIVFDFYEFLLHLYELATGSVTRYYHKFAPPKHLKPTRVPTHLTILLGLEEPHLEHLVDVVLWCLAARISFLSFYDRKGVLKKQEDKFQELVEHRKPKGENVIWQAARNGFSGNKIHVKILCENDGRSAIAQTAKEIACEDGVHQPITVDDFDVKLQRKYEFPDPDLGVFCGENLCMHGYPPWQIRVTEFLTVKSHSNLTFDIFLKLLCRYSKCEQRFGK